MGGWWLEIYIDFDDVWMWVGWLMCMGGKFGGGKD